MTTVPFGPDPFCFPKQELHRIERLLRQAGFPVAASFAKARRYVQPLYGKQHVQLFQQVLEDSPT